MMAAGFGLHKSKLLMAMSRRSNGSVIDCPRFTGQSANSHPCRQITSDPVGEYPLIYLRRERTMLADVA
jgi:hypothetical protein